MADRRPEDRELAEAVDRLVDEQRIACLWYLRPDYYPHTYAARLRVLEQIERHGDRDAYRQAANLKRWL